MLAHARRHGAATLVVGVRYDTGPMVGAAEVLCYGTAVVVEPDQRHVRDAGFARIGSLNSDEELIQEGIFMPRWL